MSTDFLDRLASQLKANKSAACRRAIQRILAVVKKNLEDGKYENDVEAEADFRQLGGSRRRVQMGWTVHIDRLRLRRLRHSKFVALRDGIREEHITATQTAANRRLHD